MAVARGDGPSRPIPRGPDAGLLDLPVATSDETLAVHEVLGRNETDALLVLDDGALVCETYRTSEDATTPHALWSVTKSVVGCLAGMLIAEGALDPDAAASGYVPELAAGGYATATVRDLLDMRTGGDYCESHDDPDGELGQLGQICGWWPRSDSTLPATVREWLATMERPAASAGSFAYRSADTEVLGWVLETITDQPLATLIGQRLLAPIGAEADGLLDLDPAGCAQASGGLSLVPRDVARFAGMLLDGGASQECQVVPTRFLRDTYTGQPDSVAAFRHRVAATLGPDLPDPVNGLYRNGFWVLEQGRRVLMCLGVHGQLVLIDGEARVAVVMLSSWPAPQDPHRFDAALAAATAIVERLADQPQRGLSLHG